jgi:hypothetical protein
MRPHWPRVPGGGRAHQQSSPNPAIHTFIYRALRGPFNKKLQEWEHFYNYARPHGGLGGQTPYERLRQKTAPDVTPLNQLHTPGSVHYRCDLGCGIGLHRGRQVALPDPRPDGREGNPPDRATDTIGRTSVAIHKEATWYYGVYGGLRTNTQRCDT